MIPDGPPQLAIPGLAGLRGAGEKNSSGDVDVPGALRTVPFVAAVMTSSQGFLAEVMPLPVVPTTAPPPVADDEAPEPTPASAAVVVLDTSYRVADSTLLTALGWAPDTQVCFTVTGTGTGARIAPMPGPDDTATDSPTTDPATVPARVGGIDITASIPHSTVDSRRRLHIPTPVRRLMNLRAEQQLLLLADPDRGELRLLTIPALTTALEEQP